ncbi:MAG: hemolysin III family protein [Cellulomonas sp.]|uniref:PAQR family membrane homeostasis protein TrhA n=1 Tax=Cellulomonas sp. 73-92 TaxID=1895740 RepID=UPI000AA067A5|nr:hemolysin III family protein [Cellulomonas sp. 73-92]MBN9375752.1 hemolysin III family protein [Cellulomonas sp.]
MSSGHVNERPVAGPGDVGRELASRTTKAAAELVGQVKPKLRGWIHAGIAPFVLAAAIVLVALSPTVSARWANTVFGFSAVLLFGTSAVYHRGHWSPRVSGVLRRMDHTNIFLIIAGTYTPLAVLLLPYGTARTLLLVVWTGALVGLLMRIFWLGAPRWLYVPIYVALGWVAVWFMPQFWRSGGPGIVWLVMAGGVAYTVGAVVYGFKRPNPSPRWFGFHEIFHSLTVVGFTTHYVAVSLATYALR